MNIDNYISSGIIEQYVMGLCSNEECIEVEQLRKQYPAIDKAIVNYEIAFEQQMLQNVAMPSKVTDDSILQKLHALQTPVVSINKNKTALWVKAVAAAAVILLGVSTVYNYSLYTKNKEQETALAAKNNLPTTLPAADFSVLKNPGITPVAMYGVGIHAICRCTMFWDKKTGKAYVMIHHLVKSGDKRDYQLWAMVDGKPVNVGLVNDEIRDRFIEVTNVPANATAFSVTLENAGGSNIPTVEETYLEGKLI
jgi:anti-sigma-K factor RskA